MKKFLFGLFLFIAFPTIAPAAQWDMGACERVASGSQPTCPSFDAQVSQPSPQFVTIATPVTGARYITTSNTIILTGTAACSTGDPKVTWTNNQGGSGTMSGTTSWTMTGTGAVLTPDQINVITVTNTCSSGSPATDSLSVAYSPAVSLLEMSLDENAGTAPQDTSGFGNHGTFGAGVAYTSTAQKYGASALDFSGGSVSITSSSISQQIKGGFSFVAWVNPDVLPSGFQAIAVNNYAQYLYASTSGSSNCQAGVPQGGFDDNGTANVVCSPTPLPVGQYSCLAVTYDGVNMDMYINKTRVARVPKNYEFPGTITGTFEIGSSTFNEDFNGKIDEFRFRKYGMTSTEVEAACDTQIGTPPSGAPTSLKVGSVSVRIGDKDIKLGF